MERGREIKRAGDEEKGNESAPGALPIVPARPSSFNFRVFSLFLPFSRRFPTEGASAEERDTGLCFPALDTGHSYPAFDTGLSGCSCTKNNLWADGCRPGLQRLKMFSFFLI